MEKNIKPGIYAHYKGGLYRVMSIGRSSDNLEPQVIYQSLNAEHEGEVWTRPASEWSEIVTTPEGKKTPRFTPFDLASLDFYFDKIALLAIKNGKILMARSKGKRHFYMPGGKREIIDGTPETDIECLSRECSEELNININPDSAQHFVTYTAHSYPDKPAARLTFYRANFKGTPRATNEIEEIAWLAYKDRAKAIGSGRLIMDELYYKEMIK